LSMIKFSQCIKNIRTCFRILACISNRLIIIVVIETRLDGVRESLNKEDESAQIQETLVRENLKRVSVLKDLYKANYEASTKFFQRSQHTLDAAHYTSLINELEEAGRQREEEVRLAEAKVTNMGNALHREHAMLMELKDSAEVAWEGVQDEENEYIQTVFPDGLTIYIKELIPMSIDDLEEEMNQQQALAEIADRTNESVVKDYDDRVKEIQKLKDIMERKRSALEETEQQINDIKEEWYPVLKELVGKISTNFQAAFEREFLST
jgi:chromosome segregation ATPase